MRKSTGKRLRFEILKRDGFRCKYCGVTSAASMLHVDHVVAVSDGGTNDPANLVTACIDCNGGKSNIDLSESALPECTPTDAMLEHVEQMRAYLDSVKEQDVLLGEMADYALEIMHREAGYVPAFFRGQLRSAIRQDGLDDVITAIYATAKARGVTSSDDRQRYFFGVLRNMRANRVGS